MNISNRMKNKKILPPLLSFFLISAFSLLMVACEEEKKTSKKITKEPVKLVDTTMAVKAHSFMPIKKSNVIPYDLNNPDLRMKLDKDLIEISGLSLSPDKNYLYGVNDEEAKVFVLDKSTGEVIDKIKFGKDGDYEGVEVVGKDIYVVKNNGNLYRVKKKKKDDAKKYKNFLGEKHDVEGLGYDPTTNSLLLVCKGIAGEGKKLKKAKAVYRFDLENKKMDKKPLYLVTENMIVDFLKKSKKISDDSFMDKMGSKAIVNRAIKFAPSGIAIHPISLDIYMISSVGKIMLVLNQEGRLKHFEFLDKSIFPQPEGICFEMDGSLYISSEGKNKKANIFLFKQLL